jgi:drug/metabolite transporter (DMT)-like permease
LGDWIVSIEGTEAGARLALVLALLAAVLHAVFGALQKGRHDPLLARGVIDASYGLMAAPFALFVVPWPEPHMWPIFAGAFVIHAFYKWTTLAAYRRGAYTVVYPVMRGTGPLFTVIGAWLVFGETFAGVQWLGVAVLLAGLYGLALYNMARITVARETLVPALWFAVLTGLFVALYTTYDAYGIRATADPFTFLAWFFFIDGMLYPFLAWAF